MVDGLVRWQDRGLAVGLVGPRFPVSLGIGYGRVDLRQLDLRSGEADL